MSTTTITYSKLGKKLPLFMDVVNKDNVKNKLVTREKIETTPAVNAAPAQTRWRLGNFTGRTKPAVALEAAIEQDPKGIKVTLREDLDQIAALETLCIQLKADFDFTDITCQSDDHKIKEHFAMLKEIYLYRPVPLPSVSNQPVHRPNRQLKKEGSAEPSVIASTVKSKVVIPSVKPAGYSDLESIERNKPVVPPVMSLETEASSKQTVLVPNPIPVHQFSKQKLSVDVEKPRATVVTSDQSTSKLKLGFEENKANTVEANTVEERRAPQKLKTSFRGSSEQASVPETTKQTIAEQGNDAAARKALFEEKRLLIGKIVAITGNALRAPPTISKSTIATLAAVDEEEEYIETGVISPVTFMWAKTAGKMKFKNMFATGLGYEAETLDDGSAQCTMGRNIGAGAFYDALLALQGDPNNPFGGGLNISEITYDSTDKNPDTNPLIRQFERALDCVLNKKDRPADGVVEEEDVLPNTRKERSTTVNGPGLGNIQQEIQEKLAALKPIKDPGGSSNVP